MPMLSVELPNSSAVSAFAYDEESRELYIRYRGGAAYTYFDVPLAEFLSLQSAPSIGAFVNASIKPSYACAEGAPI